MKFNDISDTTKYLPSNLVDYRIYESVMESAEWLRENYKNEVTGFWFIETPAEDGGVQAIIRLADDVSVMTRLYIHGGVFDYLFQEQLYNITASDSSIVDFLINEEHPYFFPDRIYCVFDDNRKDTDFNSVK